MQPIDHISWEEVERLSRQLASQIDEDFDILVCILRGGAIPGVILANELEIDTLLGVKVQQQGQEMAVLNTNNSKNSAPYQGMKGKILVPLNDFPLTNRKVLVVDDVLDSGESARLIMEEINLQKPSSLKLATLHIKTYSSFKPDYYGEVRTNWLFYPWMSSDELEKMHEHLELAAREAK